MALTKIFISYRRDDSEREVEALEEQLEALQGGVFRDVSEIGIADPFPTRIKDALQEADFVLVVIGKKWLEIFDKDGRRRLDDPDDFVRREISYALRRLADHYQLMHVIPVLVQGAKMPKASELPQDLKALAGITAQRISRRSFDADIVSLSTDINVLRRKFTETADSLLDEIDEEMHPTEPFSLYATAAGNPELRNLPELATWHCTIDNGCDLRFQTKESGSFDGELLKPRKVRIEGFWRLLEESGGSLVMTLKGSTFDGEDFNMGIPIERRAGERSYSGRNNMGEYFRMEWLSRGERSEDRF